MKAASKSRRPGGRSARTQRAVFHATVEILAGQGWAALSIEAIAERAEVHKTTIYRRWTDREQLAVAAVSDHLAAQIPFPDTGTLDGDLHALSRAIAAEFRTPAGVALARLGAAQHNASDPRLRQLGRRVLLSRYQQVQPIVDRAIARGEAPPGTDGIAVARTISAPLLIRVLITGEPLEDHAADQAAATAIAAIRAGVLTTADAPGQ